MAHQWQEGVEWENPNWERICTLSQFINIPGQEMEKNNYSLHVGTIFRFIQWDINREYLAYKKHLRYNNDEEDVFPVSLGKN